MQNQRLKLTPQTIKKEITAYQDRLSNAQEELAAMPVKGKRIRATRRKLEAEAAHVLGLIRLASEALAELE